MNSAEFRYFALKALGNSGSGLSLVNKNTKPILFSFSAFSFYLLLKILRSPKFCAERTCVVCTQSCKSDMNIVLHVPISNWPHRHYTLCPSIILLGLRLNKEKRFKTGNLSAPIFSVPRDMTVISLTNIGLRSYRLLTDCSDSSEIA